MINMETKMKSSSQMKHLDTAELKNTADDIRTLIDGFQESKESVKTATTKLLDVWHGNARNEFESKYGLFINKIGDLEDALIEYYNALLEAESIYSDTDDKMAQNMAAAE